MIEIKNTFNKRGRLSLFQIFVLILGSIAIAYFIGVSERVSGAELKSLNDQQWSGLCGALGNYEAKGPLDLVAVKDMIPSLGIGVTNVKEYTIDEKTIVEKCMTNQKALAKLDDQTLLNGINNNLASTDTKKVDLFGGENSKVFAAVTDKLNAKDPGAFLTSFNDVGNNKARKAWLENLKIGDVNRVSVDGKENAPQVLSYKEGILEIQGQTADSLKTKINVKSFEGKKIEGKDITAKVFPDGKVELSNGAVISGKGNAEVSYGEKGLSIIADGKDAVVDLSNVNNPQTDSAKVELKNNAVLKTSGGNYQMVGAGKSFSAEVYKNSNGIAVTDIQGLGTDKIALSDASGNKLYEFSGSSTNDGRFVFSGDKFVEFTKGTLSPVGGNPITMKEGVGVVPRTGVTAQDYKDYLVMDKNRLLVDSTGAEFRVDGNGKFNAEIGGKLDKNAKISMENADANSKLALGDKKITLTNNDLTSQKNNLKEFMNGKELDFSHNSNLGTNKGKVVTDAYTMKGDQVVQSTKVGGLAAENTGLMSGGQQGSGLGDKSKNSSSWKNWGIALLILAVVAGGAYFLLSKKKDDKKDKNSTSNSTNASSSSSSSTSSGSGTTGTSSRGTSTTGTSSTGTSTSSGTTTPAATV